MDFKFIECGKALAVISCKSFAKSVDKKYCRAFAQYGMENIILFAECCEEGKDQTLRDKAKKEGYLDFFHLYTIDKNEFVRQDPTVYTDFITLVKELVAVRPPRRKKSTKRRAAKK